ncbi:MAG: hypothetical protein ABGW77_03845 [Campylobacterales bacterium]
MDGKGAGGKELSREELKKLKEIVKEHPEIGEEERSNTLKHLEEWYIEDQAEGILLEELLERFPFLEGLLMELGLV